MLAELFTTYRELDLFKELFEATKKAKNRDDATMYWACVNNSRLCDENFTNCKKSRTQVS